MMPQKPLLLKDLLELDPFASDTCSQQQAAAALIRSRSKSAVSAVINAVKNLQALTSPTRSKKLTRRFWKKNNNKEQQLPKITVKDIVRFSSFKTLYYCPSPAVSTTCSVTDTPSSLGGDHRRSEEVESQSSLECRECQSEEEKEQLSPVSVMDFPYDDDDQDEEGNGDENFEENLTIFEKTTQHLLQKIRRFESLAELDPVDLQQRFSTSEDEDDEVAASEDEITAWTLIRRMRSIARAGPHEKLLLDFFTEGLSAASVADVDGLISAAAHWIDGEDCLRTEERMSAMEDNGRWGSFEEGRDDVAVDVEASVLGSLMGELVLDLVIG